MRSTYSRRAEAQPNVIIDQRNAIRKLAVTSAQPHSKQDHRTNWWGRITYTAVLLSSLFLGILAWRSLDLNNPDIPDWKPVLALADTAQQKRRFVLCKESVFAGGEPRSSARRLAGINCRRMCDV